VFSARHVKPLVVLILVLCFAGPAQWPAQAVRAQAPAAEAQAPAFTILLANDDGFDAPGLRALTEALRPLGEIYVSAPATEQSGKGHSIITTREPIFVNERRQPDGKTWWAIEAPPATCVRLAVESLLPRRPDLVVSGINRGDNLGLYSAYLSGTMGAAREAAIVGIPAIAVSMSGNNEADYAATAAYIRELVEELRAKNLLKPGFFLNVNRPAGEVKGVRVTRMSLKPSIEDYERRESPRRRVYFWSRYRPPQDEEEGTDIAAFRSGFIALTPMVLDVSDRAAAEKLQVLRKDRAAAAK
jgi:5'-nucleotidase